MPELGFRARDVSPDSVIFTPETNLSLFSSASASVERCSFASDTPDQDSAASLFSQHLSCSDPDPNKSTLLHKNSSIISLSRNDKSKDGSGAETTEDENLAVDSARSSFSQALKECQERRLRSEVLKKNDRRRPASLDFNNSLINAVNSSSPRLGVMKKPSASARKTATFPSPGTPNYRHTSVGIQKGWSSERVPLHTRANRRSLNTVLLSNGRTLPSKWEDAERWIFSPVSGDGGARTSFQQPQRRPKSKSGPLGAPGVAYHQMFSPAAPIFKGGNKFPTACSPFSAGVMALNGFSVQYGECDGGGHFNVGSDPCMARSISIHGCSEMVPLPGQQDVKFDSATNNISRVVSRRDMATQMSPESSTHSSSPGSASSFSLGTPGIQTIVQLHSAKAEIRDVPVDEQVSVVRRSKKKHRGITSRRGSRSADEWKRKADWELSTQTSSKSISKIQREEAKITAWENLQKVKAETAIRKLEMKLEKKRSSSMDNIMRKLRTAQKKAQDMRSSAVGKKSSSSQKKSLSSLRECFTSCRGF